MSILHPSNKNPNPFNYDYFYTYYFYCQNDNPLKKTILPLARKLFKPK
jgi:hypothetical protein